jgi:hypothetical protein
MPSIEVPFDDSRVVAVPLRGEACADGDLLSTVVAAGA